MISTSVLYALLSLTCAGVNDVVFKRYAGKDRSRGVYVFGIGLIWLILQVAYAAIRGIEFTLSDISLVYGLAAGVLLTGSNILLLESLSHIDASLGSTVYRLNTVGVVALSVLFLQESLGWFKVLGVVAGVGAVILLYRPGGHGEATGRRFALFFALAVAASLLRAVYGVVSKAGLNQGASLQTLLVLSALCWVIGGFVYALVREKRFRMTGKKAAYASLSGVLVFLIVNFLLLAIEKGQASVVIPIANMSFAVALLLAVGLGMERLTLHKIAAVSMAVGSILMLSLV
ncbi:MAG: DMT family transporter [Desulfuromonadaceae bacterium]|nr:DMT family transporter [Desulfuromonadaceae bacterium]